MSWPMLIMYAQAKNLPVQKYLVAVQSFGDLNKHTLYFFQKLINSANGTPQHIFITIPWYFLKVLVLGAITMYSELQLSELKTFSPLDIKRVKVFASPLPSQQSTATIFTFALLHTLRPTSESPVNPNSIDMHPFGSICKCVCAHARPPAPTAPPGTQTHFTCLSKVILLVFDRPTEEGEQGGLASKH